MLIRDRWLAPWLVIALCGILGLGGGVIRNLTASDDVTMVASVYVRPPTSGNPSDAVQGEQYARSLAQLFASLAPGVGLGERVKARLHREGIGIEPATVTATAPQDAAVVNIVFAGSDVDSVQRTGDALLAELPAYAAKVRGSAGVASEDVTVTVEQSKAAGPSLLSRLAGLAVWVVAGLMLGWAAVWFAGRRRSAVESDAEVREITGVSTLVDYRFGASRSARVVAAQLLAAAGPRRAIVLISARHIDGARQVAGELAAAFADLGERGVLVIGDAVAEPSSLSRVPANAACFLTCRPAVTRATDLSLLATMVTGNGAAPVGALVVRGIPRGGDPMRSAATASTVKSTEPQRDWSRIDVFENASAGRR